jgi:hypothetical protein
MQEPDMQQLLKQLVWDYKISAADLKALIEGRKETAGHYKRRDIFKKILESYSWFTVLQIFTVEQIHELLTEELVKSLRTPSLQQKYAFIRKRLQETIPVTG